MFLLLHRGHPSDVNLHRKTGSIGDHNRVPRVEVRNESEIGPARQSLAPTRKDNATVNAAAATSALASNTRSRPTNAARTPGIAGNPVSVPTSIGGRSSLSAVCEPSNQSLPNGTVQYALYPSARYSAPAYLPPLCRGVRVDTEVNQGSVSQNNLWEDAFGITDTRHVSLRSHFVIRSWSVALQDKESRYATR